MEKKMLVVILFLATVIIFSACQKQIDQPAMSMEIPNGQAHKNGGGRLQHYDASVMQSWYALMLKLAIETPGHTPPIVARSFGYAGVAAYASIVGELPNKASLAGQLNGLNSIPQRKYGHSYYAPATVNAALASIIKKLFQNTSAINLGKIDALESANELLYAGQVGQPVIDRSVDYGRDVAEAVFKWSQGDGGDQAYLNIFPSAYMPPMGVDKWIPTPTQYQPAMLPYWGNNRPMVSTNGPGPIDPPDAIAFSSVAGSSFYDAANEVYQTGINLSQEQKNIGLYWNDGAGTFSPPGHIVAIALQMIRNHNLNLYQATTLLAKLGIAENDAGIVCWRAKFKANLLRPITFIKSYIDPAWTSLIPTPPFPTYTSGHSTFSAAGGSVLSFEIGSNISFTDSSKIEYGFSARSFSNFNAFAREAAVSRLYGGIHYSFDNERGFDCGELIAKNVEQLRW